MRRLVVALIAAVMLVGLIGCGGGGDTEEETPVTQTEVEPSANTKAPEAEEQQAVDFTPDEDQAFEPFPTDAEVLTKEMEERLEAERPVLLLFYDSAQKTTDDQQEYVDKVIADYQGLIDLVSYNVGTYIDVAEDGEITASSDLIEDEEHSKVARLLSDDYLGVGFTPYIVFVNGDGQITHRIRGPVDNKLLEREVLRATE